MRPTRDEWALTMALVTAERSTCLRRRVGCVLLNARGHVLATGCNGVAAGVPHCNEAVYRPVTLAAQPELVAVPEWPNACEGARAPSGTNLDGCHAIHAEQNALLQCSDVWDIDTCVTTTAPCLTCVKLLLNTGCRRVVWATPYAHQEQAERLWRQAGRAWEQLPAPTPF
jgi:dCMP deaminase